MTTIIPRNKVKIELYSGNVIWKLYFPETRSKFNFTPVISSGNPTSQQQNKS
jgi:hypothetical protein